MKERPILFSGAMIRAILAGTKTQTRRIVKPQPVPFGSVNNNPDHANIAHLPWMPVGGVNTAHWKCPYGQPGDRLWVRETLRANGDFMVYAADSGRIDCGDMDWPACIEKRRSIPSIHMPRWASRIALKITGVRVERLQAISAADALAEGVNVHPDHHDKPLSHICSPVRAYRDVWEAINGPESWDANPWVWVVEFRRIDQ